MVRFVAFLWIAATIPAAAFATIFVQRPLQQEIQETPTIVRGTVGASYADWGSDGGSRRIYTYYQLQLGETLKGDAGTGTVRIRELGGEKDGIGMQIAGAAHFSSGEDVVVFLGEKNEDGSYTVHGLSSGKFNLTRRADGAECLSGIALAEPEGDGFVHPDEGGDSAPGDGRCTWTLASLREAIRDEGDAPKDAAAPTPVVSPGPRVAASPEHRPAAPAPRLSAPQEAPQLQPASQERESSRGGRLWIAILAIGLAGLGLLLLKPRR